MHRTIFILSLLFLILPAKAQPKHEVRAAWITAVYGLDWPRTRATTPQGIRKQKEELVDILDKLKAANFNTVLFQTRTRGDVLYPSSIEPFNSILTGKVGMPQAGNGMSCVDGDYSARQQKARRFSRQTICHQASERYMRAL